MAGGVGLHKVLHVVALPGGYASTVSGPSVMAAKLTSRHSFPSSCRRCPFPGAVVARRWCGSSSENQCSPSSGSGRAQQAVQKAARIEADLDHARLACTNAESLRAYLEAAAIDREELRVKAELATAERAEMRRQMADLAENVRGLLDIIRRENVGHRQPASRREGMTGGGAASRMVNRPTLDFAVLQPSHVCELGHEALAELALSGNQAAHRERLLREIMAVDNTTWDNAHEVLVDMDRWNNDTYWLLALPYRIGIGCAIVLGCAGCTMVFYKPIALWYGLSIAMEDLPQGVESIDDLTTNQVGTWTWSWMEPMLGTASFLLLCCQFSRAQAKNMQMKPFTEMVGSWRATRLANAYGAYDRSIVRAWGKHMPQRNKGFKGPTSGL